MRSCRCTIRRSASHTPPTWRARSRYCSTALSPARQRRGTTSPSFPGRSRYALTGAGEPLDDLSREDVFVHVLDRIVHGLIVKMDSATALHAGAVTWNGATVLVAGPTGAGKTSVVAWLADRGFGFLTDELVIATEGGARLIPLPRALVAKAANAAAIASLPAYRAAGRFRPAPDLRSVPRNPPRRGGAALRIDRAAGLCGRRRPPHRRPQSGAGGVPADGLQSQRPQPFRWRPRRAWRWPAMRLA